MNQREFYKRISRVIDPELLSGKRTAVIGVGSGGSRVAVELARLGVRLLLIDRPGECLEEHNIVRHFLGYRSLGKRKLPELRKAIRNLNPSAHVRCMELDVVEDLDAFATQLGRWRADLVAVCTDNEQSKHAVDSVARGLGITQVGAGVYDGGVGGEVYRVRPGEACYGCIAEKLQLQRYTPADQIRPDYNHLETAETPSASALNLDIEQIACLQTRLILDELLGKNSCFTGLEPAINLCVFANRIVPGTFARPFHADFYKIEKCPDCLDCGVAAVDVERDAQRILDSLESLGRVASGN